MFQIIPYNGLSCTGDAKSTIKALLDKLVVIKLNGGLGTSMGCVGPKSLIPVRNELTFLDLTVHLIQVFVNVLHEQMSRVIEISNMRIHIL